MKKIKTEDAIGMVIAHDMTQIIPGKFKGARFKKGHIIQEEDIPVLLSMGKENIYIMEMDENTLHEDDAAKILESLSINEGMKASLPKEGKIGLSAIHDGLLKINKEALYTLNSQPQMMIAARHNNDPLKAGDQIAGMRVIPLTIEKEKMQDAVDAVHEVSTEPIFKLLPFEKKKAVVLVTGSEVYHGRIEDQFGPVLIKKLQEYDCPVLYTKILPDDPEWLTKEILEAKNQGAELILCTGGMSVDPDDQTPLAIKNTGANIISYGSPVLPGAMMLVSYLDDVPVLGLPGCVMYSKRTIFDLLLPRILANDPITKEDLAAYGHGGLCLNCNICTWPNCGFGKV
jgi:molybdenum cofactor synthesis domain-containing protein